MPGSDREHYRRLSSRHAYPLGTAMEHRFKPESLLWRAVLARAFADIDLVILARRHRDVYYRALEMRDVGKKYKDIAAELELTTETLKFRYRDYEHAVDIYKKLLLFFKKTDYFCFICEAAELDADTVISRAADLMSVIEI